MRPEAALDAKQRLRGPPFRSTGSAKLESHRTVAVVVAGDLPLEPSAQQSCRRADGARDGGALQRSRGGNSRKAETIDPHQCDEGCDQAPPNLPAKDATHLTIGRSRCDVGAGETPSAASCSFAPREAAVVGRLSHGSQWRTRTRMRHRHILAAQVHEVGARGRRPAPVHEAIPFQRVRPDTQCVVKEECDAAARNVPDDKVHNLFPCDVHAETNGAPAWVGVWPSCKASGRRNRRRPDWSDVQDSSLICLRTQTSLESPSAVRPPKHTIRFALRTPVAPERAAGGTLDGASCPSTLAEWEHCWRP